jgi:hypothetical protein
MAALTDIGTKDSVLGGASVDEQVTDAGSVSVRDPPVQADTHEASVCDITLVLGRTGVVNCDAVCGLLIKCLQDVGFIVFTLRLAFVY